MATIPRNIITEDQLAEALDRVVQRMGGDVIRIRYKFQPDSTGDDAIYFRVVLSADAAQRSRLRKVAARVREVLDDEINARESFGVIPYSHFRSESEPESNHPGWA